jgi:hypothetical protein
MMRQYRFSNISLVDCLLISARKNVDIKLSARDTFLELPSSDTFKIERLENQLIQSFGSNKTKRSKQVSDIVSSCQIQIFSIWKYIIYSIHTSCKKVLIYLIPLFRIYHLYRLKVVIVCILLEKLVCRLIPDIHNIGDS